MHLASRATLGRVPSVVFHVPDVPTEIDADLAQVLIDELALTPDRGA
jgi:hypothetical protein